MEKDLPIVMADILKGKKKIIPRNDLDGSPRF